MKTTLRLVWFLSFAVAVGCGDDEGECEVNDDCEEVNCPDGTRVKRCDDGTCFVFKNCDDDGGW